MKADERWLLEQCKRQMREGGRRVDLRELMTRYRLRRSRVIHLSQKWTLRGWYDYDADLLNGWLTEEGMDL